MNWLHYLMEANLYLGVFYLCYCLFLNRETHYNMSRAYLLFSCMAAFTLPVVQLGILKPLPPAAPVVYKPVIAPLQQVTWAVPPPPPAKPAFTWNDMLLYAYLIGAGIFLLILLFKLYKLVRLARLNRPVINNGYNIVPLDEPNTAFSFFKYLFIGTSPQVNDTVIRHELVHIRQKHSADILFIEVLKVINWFNPFIYLVQRSLRAVHEYIADEQTASAGSGTLAYSSFLVENAYGLGGASVTHSFFNYNLLKKRIIMLHQKRSGKLARLKYLLTVPVCSGLLCASTLAFSKDYAWVDLAPRKTKNISNITSGTIPLKQTGRTDTVNRAKMHKTSDRVPGAPLERYHVTGKGYRYDEMVYFINGKGDYRVLIWDKHDEKEYWKSKTSAEEAKMLKNKYGYTFPEMPIYSKLPPPPPMATPQPGHLAPPPPPPAPADGKHQSPPPMPPKLKDQPSASEQKLPPPPPVPPVYNTTNTQLFSTLYKQISRVILYPAQDHDQKVQGKVFLKFNITADKKIENIEAMRGPDNNLTNAAIAALKKCDAPNQAKPGVYVLPIDFVIKDSSDNFANGPTPVKDYQFSSIPNNAVSLNEIVVTSYVR